MYDDWIIIALLISLLLSPSSLHYVYYFYYVCFIYFISEHTSDAIYHLRFSLFVDRWNELTSETAAMMAVFSIPYHGWILIWRRTRLSFGRSAPRALLKIALHENIFSLYRFIIQFIHIYAFRSGFIFVYDVYISCNIFLSVAEQGPSQWKETLRTRCDWVLVQSKTQMCRLAQFLYDV